MNLPIVCIHNEDLEKLLVDTEQLAQVPTFSPKYYELMDKYKSVHNLSEEEAIMNFSKIAVYNAINMYRKEAKLNNMTYNNLLKLTK